VWLGALPVVDQAVERQGAGVGGPQPAPDQDDGDQASLGLGQRSRWAGDSTWAMTNLARWRVSLSARAGRRKLSMRVQHVPMPGSRAESWTVLGDDHVTVEPIERFLAYLTSIERSPNTVKAYAHDQKDWFVSLGGRAGSAGR